MNIAFDPREWSATSPIDAAPHDCAHPDWHVLRTRLQVGLESRGILGKLRNGSSARQFGSFSRRAASSLERITIDCDAVNQTNSVNRKRGGCIIPQVAGMRTIGERG